MIVEMRTYKLRPVARSFGTETEIRAGNRLL